jgi:hypothetical protein
MHVARAPKILQALKSVGLDREEEVKEDSGILSTV